MSQHTPGPWMVSQHSNGSHLVVCDNDGMPLAGITPQMDDIENANARLIACAPELYESLREIRGFLGKCKPSQDVTTAECFDAMSRADALLAKVAP